jgi:cellulose biosynthesis protein BcsQ
MRTIAIYNIKGGVGKTTTAVNLSYLASESRLRVLLWDLDPQAASTFAFRIRPHVQGFRKRSLDNGEALCAAIKQTDYDNLCLLPADFAYHKLDRLLSSVGDPARVLASLLATIGDGFDIVFLDCPAGFSRLAEGILAAADAIVAPAIPTVLSLRMVAQLVRQAEASRSGASLATVFNMVDRRKTLHRRACELAAEHRDVFLAAEIPYASVVEQMAARRMPTAVYAAQTPAARAFTEMWAELQRRVPREKDNRERRWAAVLHRIESVIEGLETTERPLAASHGAPRAKYERELDVVHRFDTETRDLEQRGTGVELRERAGGEFVVVACSNTRERAEARIDRWWTVQILAGEISPLEALERRIGFPPPRAVEQVRAAAKGRQLRRVDTYRSEYSTVADASAPDLFTVPQ